MIRARASAGWTAAILITLAGLALRAWMAALNGFPSVDGVLYMDQAAALVRHGRLPFSSFPPGWPLVMSLPLLLLDDGSPAAVFTAARTANVLLGGLLPLLGFTMFRARLGDRLALAGVVILAFLPQAIVAAKGDLSEMSYACALLGGWLLLERGRRLPAGLLIGFGYVIRPEALLAGLAVGLYLWVRERRLPWTLGLGLAVPMAPLLLFIHARSGHWSLTAKQVFLEQTLAAHPGWRLALHAGGNLAELAGLLAGMLGAPLILLALWGAVRRPGPWLLFLAPLLPLPLFDFVMAPRFWVPYLPFLLLAAGLGAIAAVEGIGTRLAPRRGSAARYAVGLLVVLALASAARDDAVLVRRNPEAFYGLKDAGAWLADRVDPDTMVAAYKPYASFWAGCRFLKLPDEDNADLLVAWARNHGARYLVANVLVAHTLAPGLDDLLQDPLPPRLAGRLTLVELFRYDLVEHNTAVYRIKDPLQP